ncbi:MAG: hypothetical protein ABSC19_12205 [Syntrophorhabdales bacterium]
MLEPLPCEPGENSFVPEPLLNVIYGLAQGVVAQSHRDGKLLVGNPLLYKGTHLLGVLAVGIGLRYKQFFI